MTSKEALETLFEILCEREHTNSEHNFWLKLFNDVAKDLEILEFIKSDYKMNDYNELVPKYLVITKCDYVAKFIKLKEMLENDNNIKK